MPHAIIPKNIQTKEEAILEDENYLHLLPSNEDIIDYVKYSILVCLQSKNGLLTTDKFGAEIDMEHLNFIYHVAATDIELVHSVMSCIRLYLVPKGDVLSEEKEKIFMIYDENKKFFWVGKIFWWILKKEIFI